MTEADRWRRVEHVLDAVLTCDPTERPALLDATCTGDPELRREVEALLGRLGAAEGFLATPPAAAAAALVAEVHDAGGDPAGRRIGAYRIVREVGRGGMSRVYLAERADGAFTQRVALKLLRPGLDSELDLGRFRAERQILATLSHPHIARLLDGGVTDAAAGGEGAPYLVLEYVDGAPIDRHCETHALSVAQRLALFATVAEATEHAHRRLVVHRDLKPSNVLVTTPAPTEAGGEVKLLDFGLAKLLQGAEAGSEAGSDAAPTTRAGHRWMTPEYAAPEQVRGEPVTTLTDVYQLGALLYELLAGRPPFGRRDETVLELAVLRDDPAPPSSVAQAPLRRALRGDVDAIVLKALRKEPEHRYPSAGAFAEDVRRHLAGRPVLARSDATTYRVRKFVGRHRGAVLVATLGIVALAAAGVRERTLRGRAERAAARATAVEGFLVGVFDVADPFALPDTARRDVTARALLDRGAARLDASLATAPEAQADLRQVLGGVYANLGLYDRAEPLLRRALAQRRALYGPRHPAVAEAMDRLGTLLESRDQFPEAESLLRDALAQRRALLGRTDTATAQSLGHLGTLLRERNEFAAAEPLLREALAIQSATSGDTSLAVASSLGDLALLLYQSGDYDGALPLYRRQLAIDERRLGENHPETAATLHNIAQVQDGRGESGEAEALYRRALAAKRRTLGDLHPSVTVNLNNLAQVVARQEGRLDEAEALVREALSLDRKMFGERHGYVAESMRNLGNILRRKGDFAEAEQLFEQALAVNRSLYGDENITVAINEAAIAGVRLLQGDAAGALPMARRSYERYARLQGERHRSTLIVGFRVARALRESGAPRDAEQLARTLLSRLDTTTASTRTVHMDGEIELGRALLAEGRAAEARPALERAVALARPEEERWRVADARLALGECLTALGDRAQALPLLRAAAEALRTQRRAQPRLAREAAAALAGRS
ncbi:MAG: serine/threonine protein kinase [Gemmatirosa sp.]|nr:serine/threonine protein kinase [Gemmatirosa sp.]